MAIVEKKSVLKKGAAVTWETAGRGGRNQNTGVIAAFVEKGTTPPASLPKAAGNDISLDHVSNRDRYVIKVTVGEKVSYRFANANAVKAAAA